MSLTLEQGSNIILPPGTVLHDTFRLLRVIGMAAHSITYEAETDGSHAALWEYVPADAVREGTELQSGQQKDAEEKTFLRIVQTLQKGLTHFAPVTEVFRENNTCYAVSPLPKGQHLHQADLTPTYVRSLGMMLCESYAALHRAGLYYGAISREHLWISEDGSLTLDSRHIHTDGSAAEDLRGLVSFLSALLPETEDEDAAFPEQVLHRNYADADALKAAMAGKKSVNPRKRRGILCLLLCLLSLAVGIILMQQIPEKSVPLSEGLSSGRITPEVISVWLPLAEGADEESTCAMYKRLADGFERQNPGCGVNVVIYADDSFTDAVAHIGDTDPQPAVFMDTQDESVMQRAADLGTLTAALPDVYLTDLNRFDTSLPLGCSIPVLFYNDHWTDMKGQQSISFADLPDGTLYDVTAADYLANQNTTQKPTDCFAEFLENGKDTVLASSTCMVLAEHSGISSGAVHMLPIAAADGFPLQYEMYCSVNAESDANTRHIAMLWLQYLMSEEAQQVLFVEHYGVLPLHETAFASAVAAHQELSVLLGTQAEETIPTETEVQP